MSEVGTFRKYATIEFKGDRAVILQHAAAITQRYEAQSVPMSLRQLYYQLVAKNLIDNNKGMYDRVGSVVSDGRMAGLISWTAIEDRGRSLRGLETYDSPEQLLKAAQASYRIDMWANQEYRPEVWVEKEALVGVVGQICEQLRVDYFACKGYNSQSEAWRAGRRFASYVQKGQRPIVFHLGDHDPSGLDMTRDNRDRLALFAGTGIQVARLALNMDQIERYNLPPNYAKITDSRYGEYVKKYGEESWELDALDPRIIRDLIHDAVVRVRNEAKWDEMIAIETEDRQRLEDMAGG